VIARLMGLRTISPEALNHMIEERRVTVIDVNSPERWAEAHVPGARSLDPNHYDERQLPADKDSGLVFYCSGPLCRKAPKAARWAQGLGYRDVMVMSAGIQGWLGAKLPTETE
jgi:rhodanese-related sulfurtransferase